MKKIIVPVIVALIVMILVIVFKDKIFKGKTTKREINFLNIDKILITYSVSYSTAPLTYIVDINNNSAALKILDSSDNVLREATLTEGEVFFLRKALEDNEVETWNNFHGSNPDVLDGESFSLNIKTDIKEISCGGTNSFPKNYRGFTNAFFEAIKRNDVD